MGELPAAVCSSKSPARRSRQPRVAWTLSTTDPAPHRTRRHSLRVVRRSARGRVVGGERQAAGLDGRDEAALALAPRRPFSATSLAAPPSRPAASQRMRGSTWLRKRLCRSARGCWREAPSARRRCSSGTGGASLRGGARADLRAHHPAAGRRHPGARVRCRRRLSHRLRQPGGVEFPERSASSAPPPLLLAEQRLARLDRRRVVELERARRVDRQRVGLLRTAVEQPLAERERARRARRLRHEDVLRRRRYDNDRVAAPAQFADDVGRPRRVPEPVARDVVRDGERRVGWRVEGSSVVGHQSDLERPRAISG